MIKTVIFDMDGVIIDSEPVHHSAFLEHFKELGIEVSDQYYRSLTGFSTKNVYEKLVVDYNLQHNIEDLVQRKRSIFNHLFDTKEDLYLIDGVLEIIQKFHQEGIQLILASSSSKVTIDRIFKRFKLYSYFTHIVSGEDFPKSKPNPAIFLHAHKLSNHKKEECIVIEDSTNGIRAAHDSNIFCVAFDSPNSKNQDLSLANIIINNFSELNLSQIHQSTI
ncbi:beta-phosphoglucomutase [Flavobacteriaceae bacterium UJ101]|nr:beta-phosphoglucomutase [Flavobacteriaceae bacterium UJ101]